MQALKALVIALGVLIFAGLGIIGVTLYNRATRPAATPPPPPQTAQTAARTASRSAPAPFGTVRLGLAPGSTVVQMETVGARIVLRVRGPRGGERLYIVHAGSGRLLGTVEITPGGTGG